MINTLELCVDTALALCSTGPGGGESGVQGHPWLQSKFKTSLWYMATTLKEIKHGYAFFFLVKFSFCFILEHREEIVGKGDDWFISFMNEYSLVSYFI